jgi:uncharacterized protein (DUF1330 family)
MKYHITLLLTLVSGIGIGAAAVQGLRAQAKPKAYTVGEIEVLDNAALAPYLALVGPAIRAGGGRTLNTAGGRVVPVIGEAPKRVTIIEWDSVEQAQTFINSPAYTNLKPQRDKAERFTRGYIVEATQ